MKLKKISTLISLALVGTSILTACSNTGSKNDNKQTTVVVATDADTRPYTYKENDTLKGYDIDLVKAIFKELPQYKLEFQVTEFSSIATGLDTGRFQIGANNFAKTKEREEKYLFSSALASNANVIVSKKPNDYKNFNDLVGKTTESAPGSNYTATLEKYNKENPNKAVKIHYTEADLATRLSDVDSGKIDFLFFDAISMATLIEERGLKDLSVAKLSDTDKDFFESSYEYLLFSKQEDGNKLQQEVNKVLKKLREEGTLKKLSEEYFHDDYTPPAGE